MKINTASIPADGVTLSEVVPAGGFDLDTNMVKSSDPIEINAEVSKINNAVTVDMSVRTVLRFLCSRCLEEYKVDLHKNFRLNYRADSKHPVIDLDNDIRELIILDYPFKPLCKPDCKGLCAQCGANLNKGKCMCR